MEIQEHIPLSSLTTFRIGGPARYVVDCASVEDVQEALEFAKSVGLPLIPLGQGSNLLASDSETSAVIARISIPGIVWGEEENDVFVEVGGGVSWDSLVTEACGRDLWGIENLAGIPGTVGACPVQNIGAYGSDVAQTIVWVEAYDTERSTIQRFSNSECLFGYRESLFKRKSVFIIMRVCFRLTKNGEPKIEYADLTTARMEGVVLDSPLQIAEAVRDIRSKKFPDLTLYGTAGSFFKNPTISTEEYEVLKLKYEGLPGFAVEKGIKIPLAWILDHVLALRGYTLGPVFLFHTQPLVLVANPGATAEDVETLAREVSKKVFEATSITIEREVRSL